MGQSYQYKVYLLKIVQWHFIFISLDNFSAHVGGSTLNNVFNSIKNNFLYISWTKNNHMDSVW